jgi:transcriptional regulator with PAS, ATPase and Fis domain
MRRVEAVVDRIAATPATVLLTGESGTGKSLLAREIHRRSDRTNQRFVDVACGSLSETLLESELFGHVAGAFTGATVAREGTFSRADGGTLFLDEIATASPALQVKLLRVLQEFEFEPVGGGETRQVDTRMILATHEHLEDLVAAGRFRNDLFWRINVVTIELPPLRRRREDIRLLAESCLERLQPRAKRTVTGFSASAIDCLEAHAWPGNIRELVHAVERAVFLGSGRQISPTDLPPAVLAGGTGTRRAGRSPSVIPDPESHESLRERLATPERQLILDALRRHGWRRDAAAKELGINRATLYKKAKRLGVDLASLGRPATA